MFDVKVVAIAVKEAPVEASAPEEIQEEAPGEDNQVSDTQSADENQQENK